MSTGARGYDTPNGSYTAFRMEKDYSLKEWDDAPMPNSIFFTRTLLTHFGHNRLFGCGLRESWISELPEHTGREEANEGPQIARL